MSPEVASAAGLIGLAVLVALGLWSGSINRDAPPDRRWAEERRLEQARWAPRGPGLWDRLKIWLWKRLE